MRVTYDAEANAVYIRLTDSRPSGRNENVVWDPPEGIKAWIVSDWTEGQLRGIEILGARELLPADFLAGAERIG
jgi:uncharacterized protein YuzE